jgi:hypothetical protein
MLRRQQSIFWWYTDWARLPIEWGLTQSCPKVIFFAHDQYETSLRHRCFACRHMPPPRHASTRIYGLLSSCGLLQRTIEWGLTQSCVRRPTRHYSNQSALLPMSSHAPLRATGNPVMHGKYAKLQPAVKLRAASSSPWTDSSDKWS